MLLSKARQSLFKIYVELFKTPGAKRIASAGFIARMPVAMDAIAIILFVHSVESSYSIAGAITAVAALTTVFSSPLWSKVADRRGQAFVLKIAIPMRVIAIISFVLLVKNGASIWTWFLSIFITECGSVSIGSMTRRRWVNLIDNKNKDLLSTSYSFESLLDEFVYIIGPIITTAIVAATVPVAGILLGIAFLVIGVPLIATHKKSDPAIEKSEFSERLKSVTRNKKLQAVGIPLTIAGGCFSAVNISVVAFATEKSLASSAGLVLGAWAAGGAVSAIINGAIRWKISHGYRYLGYLIGMTVISLTFPFISNLYILAAALFLQGLCVGPLLPNGLPLVTNSVPASQMTHAITLVTSGIPLTGALSAFLSGRIIDNYGASAGLWLPFCFLLLALTSTIPYLKEYKS
jgi:MFS family permease